MPRYRLSLTIDVADPAAIASWGSHLPAALAAYAERQLQSDELAITVSDADAIWLSQEAPQAADRRWIATLTYRTDHGPVEVEHYIEDLAEIEAIVERGPDWNALEEGRFALNPKRKRYDVTVEEARKR